MKLPLTLTLAILVAGSIWGVREIRHLTTLREQHRMLVREAAELGLSSNDASQRAGITKASKRPREDAERKAKDFAERLVDFAQEMKEMQESGSRPDEAMQKRIMDMMDGMLSLSGEELKMLVTELRGRTDMDDEMRQGMISFSIMMLSQQHPEAALALFTESSDLLGDSPMSKHALSAALGQWAKDRPLAALEWIKKNAEKHPELVTDETKRAVIIGAAGSDFGLALQLIGELKLSSDDRGMMGQIARTAITPEQQTDLLRALRKQAGRGTDTENGKKLLNAGLQGLFTQVAEAGYDKSMAWMQSADLSASETAILAENLNYYQTKDDTGRWLEWLSTQPETGEKSENATRNLVRNWTEKDYRAAGEWLAGSPAGPLKETATLSYLETVAPYDPEVAVQWAETLPAANQADAMKKIYWRLHDKDEAAAEEFAASHGVDVK